MSDIGALAALRQLLQTMERDIGLEEMSPTQKDVYYAASLISEEQETFPLSDLMQHSLASNISRPTFFRCLKWLVSNGYLNPEGRSSVSTYSVKK